MQIKKMTINDYDGVYQCGSKKIMFGSDAIVFDEESYKRYDNFKEKLLNTFSRMEIEDLFFSNIKRIFKFI